MVCEAAVFIEVDDYKGVIPVARIANCVVQVLNQLLTGCHVGGWVHGVYGAALRVDVGERRQSSLLEVFIELVGMDELGHGVLLDPLVHPGVDDIGLVVVLPADTFLAQCLEDGLGAGHARGILGPAVCLEGVVNHSASRSRRSKLAVGVCRSWVLSMLATRLVSTVQRIDFKVLTYVSKKAKFCAMYARVLLLS